jgi:hypothetical protein
VVSGVKGGSHQVCQLFQSHIENRDQLVAQTKNVNAEIWATFSQREDAFPERGALLPVPEISIGTNRIRYPLRQDAFW